MNTRPGVLVVVPVYGDLPSLLDCVDSLFTTVDFSRHSVLLVNDCGPDADEIETALLKKTAGHPGFRYERNAENLGFVGTCNRAALELDDSARDILLLNSDTVTTPGFVDELEDVLYADDSHGVACARSNNATIASLPFRLTDPRAPRTMERTAAVFEAISPLLPQWYDSPVAMGFCFLTRRTLIQRFGLFDDAFAPGYGEENDYCLRIGAQGFRSLIANHALVYHAGSKSFVGARRNTLRAQHQKELERRYPFYGAATGAFLRHVVDPADRFADVLVPRTDESASAPRLVVDLRGATLPAPDAVAVLQLSPAFAVEVLADSDARDSVAALLPGLPVTTDAHPDDIVGLALLVSGSTDGDRLIEANRRYCAWALLALGPVDDRWSTRGPEAARRETASAAAESSLRTFAPSELGSLSDAWSAELTRPLAERVEALRTRFRRILLAEAVSERTASDDTAALRRVRDELQAVKNSRSYKLGNAAVTAAKRALRRPV